MGRTSPAVVVVAAVLTLARSGWIIWPALAIMMAEALVSLSTVTLTSLASYLRARRRLRSPPNRTDDPETETQEDELSLKWVVVGMTASSVLCIVLVYAVFGNEGMRWWATVVALLLACLFSLLGWAVLHALHVGIRIAKVMLPASGRLARRI